MWNTIRLRLPSIYLPFPAACWLVPDCTLPGMKWISPHHTGGEGRETFIHHLIYCVWPPWSLGIFQQYVINNFLVNTALHVYNWMRKMKNMAGEQCDVCARLWPRVEPRLINSVDDASVAKHVLLPSLITNFFSPLWSQSEQDLFVTQQRYWYPAENSWISGYRIWVLGQDWCFRRIYGEIRPGFFFLSLPTTSPHCHHFPSLYPPFVHGAHLIDRPKIQFNDLPVCL